jgi:hypothetical protein
MDKINLLESIISIYVDTTKPSKYVNYYIKDREGNYVNKTRENKIITSKTHSGGEYFVNIDYYYDIIEDLPLTIYNIINKGKYVYILCEYNWWLRFTLDELDTSNELIILNDLDLSNAIVISNLIISNNILILDRFVYLELTINLFILKMKEYNNYSIINGLKYVIKNNTNDIDDILNELNIDKNIKINKIDILDLERIFYLIN